MSFLEYPAYWEYLILRLLSHSIEVRTKSDKLYVPTPVT